jgi:hypothetical protein
MNYAEENPILAAQKYKKILQQNYLEPCGIIEWKPPPNFIDILRQEWQQNDDEDDEDESETEEPLKKKQKVN